MGIHMPVVELRWWLLGDELDGDDQAGREQSVRCQRGDVQVQFRGRKGQPIHVPGTHQETTTPPNQQANKQKSMHTKKQTQRQKTRITKHTKKRQHQETKSK